MFFKVRLVRFPTNGIYNFNLEYERLDITIQQLVTGPSGNLNLSFIDEAATLSCHDAMVAAKGWNVSGDNGTSGFTNGVSLLTGEHVANILFTNDVDPCPDSTIIQFTESPSGDCPGNASARCSYADLFTIVVNAYPGEAIHLMPTVMIYNANSGGDCGIPASTFSSTTATAVTPDLPNTTPNRNLQVRFQNPVTNGDGSCDLTVELFNNTSNDAMNIDYLEFLVKMATDQALDLDVVSDYNRPAAGGTATDTYIHFMVPDEGWTISPGGTVSIGTFHVKPTLGNITWSATFSLVDEEKSRVQSNVGANKYCTGLPLSSTTKTCSGTGDEACSYSSEAVFLVEGVHTGDCIYPFTKKVKVGFRDTVAQTTLILKQLTFVIDIETTGPVTFSSFPLPLLGWSSCPSSSTCFPDSCHVVDTSGNLIQLSYCVNIPPSSMQTLVISPAPDAFIELLFEGAGCIDAVTIRSLSMRRGVDSIACVPMYDQPPYANIPICSGNIYGVVTTEFGEGIGAVQVRMKEDGSPQQPSGCNATSCPIDSFLMDAGTGSSGGYGFCPCDSCQYFTITPYKNINPLNGVTTFDLVLISKHILGIEPLGSPYKMIAADANQSNSITTFDVVELRKLILGIYDTFPDNTSWRFIDKGHVFSNPENPFASSFPVNITHVDKLSPKYLSYDFVGVKVGDVNNTVVTGSRPVNIDRPALPLSWPNYRGNTGDAITVPVVYAGSEPLEAIQMGLRFDPNILQLISPSLGDLPDWTAGSFNLAKAEQGEIRTVWLPSDLRDQSQLAKQGDVLFNLTFKVLRQIPESGMTLQVDEGFMPCTGWRTDGTEYSLVHEYPAGPRTALPKGLSTELSATCHPNPGSNDLTVTVQSAHSGKVRIALFGPYGNRVYVRDLALEAGSQEIQIPEVAKLPTGVYIWKVYASGKKAQGHWVKL